MNDKGGLIGGEGSQEGQEDMFEILKDPSDALT